MSSVRPGSHEGVEGSDSRPLAFFADARNAYDRAANAVGEKQVDFRFGGRLLRMSFAGDLLFPLVTRALLHRRVPGNAETEPVAIIRIWDGVSTGVPLPFPSWSALANQGPDDVCSFQDDRFRMMAHQGGYALSIWDEQQRTALFYVPDPRRVPYYECGAPLRQILHWVMRGQERHLLHGAAVGNEQGCVLLGGRGGSGKSTTALVCLDAGLRYVGDDYVLVSDPPAPHAYSLYNSAKLNADNINRLPHLKHMVSNASCLATEKALYFTQEWAPQQLADGLPIRAILFPRVSGTASTTLHAMKSAAALTALAPSTLFQNHGAGAAEFQAIARLVQNVPSYALHLGTQLPEIPHLIVHLLER